VRCRGIRRDSRRHHRPNAGQDPARVIEMTQARYVMIGGFLGAGKTTAMLRLGTHLASRGRRVGLITNDQSSGLADTRILEHAGFPVREITGGCFCCRFNSLMDAAGDLARDAAPDVFLAEPVGSCTDLKATVSYPLRRLYGEDFAVAPFSVMVDPVRAARVLGLEAGRRFSPKVLYVYEKQLEEADIIVINKTDVVSAERIEALRAALHGRYPRAQVFAVSARGGLGLAPWFGAVLDAPDEGRANLPIDYDTYAEGEALLGWLNCTAEVTGTAFDGRWLLRVVAEIQGRLRARSVEIAHLKASLTSPDAPNELAVVQATHTDAGPEASYMFHEPVASGELIVNLRAEGEPELLRTVTRDTLADCARQAGLTATVIHEEHFRPSRPVPTHRLVMS
jgi:Ni2+-binding GTPase involved in maturation of urease and hydrogenase